MPLPQTEYDVEIESVAFGGEGVARIDDKVVFVPGVLPGERVHIKVKKQKADYATATLLKILEPSKKRIPPVPGFVWPTESLVSGELPYSPGYAYYYTPYANEIKLKQTQFLDFWERFPEFKKKWVKPAIVSPEEMHYRNKIKLTFDNDHGQRVLGYVMADNQTVLDLPACALARPEINAMLDELRRKPGFLHTLQPRMNLTLRYTEPNGVVFWRNQPEKNASWLKEETVLGTLSTPQGSFFQVNLPVANELITQVQAWLSEIKPDAFFDLYCGAGIFSMAASSIANPPEFMAGIDVDPDTIAAARYNAKSRNSSAQFMCNNADEIFNNYQTMLKCANTCILVDPPRTGLHPKLIHQILHSGAKHVIYISCSPDTLMRDLRRLAPGGYLPIATRMADMFPRTPHFETLTLLSLQS